MPGMSSAGPQRFEVRGSYRSMPFKWCVHRLWGCLISKKRSGLLRLISSFLFSLDTLSLFFVKLLYKFFEFLRVYTPLTASTDLKRFEFALEDHGANGCG